MKFEPFLALVNVKKRPIHPTVLLFSSNCDRCDSKTNMKQHETATTVTLLNHEKKKRRNGGSHNIGTFAEPGCTLQQIDGVPLDGDWEHPSKHYLHSWLLC